ncbi:MAG: DUF4013 domain-containing protein [Coriobacteriaceae bacterium]|nr:DUF4013 domain-containing protein [Coriobacteriaceae bacterium]
MNRTTQYLRRGWQALQGDTHWIRTIVLMALASLVPIVGPIFVVGYCFMWAKEAAWGMDKPLPSNLDGMGDRGKYGLYAAVIEIVWLVLFWILQAVFENIIWLYVIITIVMIFVSVLSNIAVLRALIYDRFRPGFQVTRILRMAAQDVGGLARCFGISLIGACAVVVGMLLVYLVADFGIAGLLVEDASLIDSALSSVSSMGVFTVTLFISSIVIVALFLAMAFAVTLFSVLSIRAYGYWVGQFEPQNWGGPDAPMPFEQDSVEYRHITVMDVQPVEADVVADEEPAEQPADDALQEDAAQPEEKTDADDKPAGGKVTRPAAKSGPASTEADESDTDKSDTDDTGSKTKRSSTRKKATAKKAAEKKADADDKPAESDATEGESEPESEDTK